MLDERIRAILGDDRIADYFGMKVESAGEGSAVVSLAVDERHLNGNGVAHGGVVFSLADVAFACAVNSRGPAVSASSSINFCAPGKPGVLRATAREISLSRKLGTYEVVVTDAAGKTVAILTGLAYRKSE
jgi:acyl-CoA thioesterase